MSVTESPETVDQYWAAVQPLHDFFSAFRLGQYRTLYPAQFTPVEADVLLAGFLFAGAIFAFSLLLVLPGVRKGERLSSIVGGGLGVFIVTSILMCNFGQDWEVAEIQSRTQYRAGLKQGINASIGVKIGLRSINVTLKGLPEVQTFSAGLVNETINYNERLSWDNLGWLVGRAGFGPYAGRFNQEFKAHQRKGSPYPIIWIAEYFTQDGEGVRWGRFYLQAGYYTHIVLWSALPLWFLSMILFKVVVRYGAYFSLLTGLSLLAGNAIFANIRNPYELIIPFEDDRLVFKWGPSFWLCVFTGLLCCLIGIVILLLDYLCQETLAKFFGVTTTGTRLKYYVVDGDVFFDPRYAKFCNYQDTIILRRSNATFAGGATFKRSVTPGSAAAMLGLTYVQFDNDELTSRGHKQKKKQSGSRISSMTSSGFSSITGGSFDSEETVTSQCDSSISLRSGYTRRQLFPTDKLSLLKRKQPRRPTLADWQISVIADVHPFPNSF